MPTFIDLFDQASLDSRWGGSAATLDDTNDRVDLSTGTLVAISGTLNNDDFAALDFTFEAEAQSDYQNLFIELPRLTAHPRCRIRVNSGQASGGDRTGASFNVSFVDVNYGSFQNTIGPADASITLNNTANIFRVTRNSSGAWELFLNGSSVGTGQEPTGTTTHYDTPANVTGEIEFNQVGFYVNSVSTSTVASLTVNSISTATPTANSQLAITYSNATGAITSVSSTAGDWNIVSDTGSVVTVDVIDPVTFKTTDPYPIHTFLSDIVLTLNDGTSTGTTTIQIQPEAGHLYGQITSIHPDGVYANDGASVGQWVHVTDINNVTFDIATGLVEALSGAGGSATYRIYDGEWGPTADVVGTLNSKLFLSSTRLAAIESRVASDSTIYDNLIGRCDTYLNGSPYNRWEFACAYALAHTLTPNTAYRDFGISLFNDEYNNGGAGGWVGGDLGGYTSRNGFRTGCVWACMFYSWMRDEFTSGERTTIIANFVTWAQYWIDYVDNSGSFRSEDTDEVTSLAGNLNMILAILESEGDAYAPTLSTWIADFTQVELFDGILNGVFDGGMWGEGRDYSIGTMQHVGELYLVGRENLSDTYSQTIITELVEGIVHNTLAGFTDLNAYGQVQAMSDYVDLSDARYYNTMLFLMTASTDADTKALGNYWLSQITPPNDSSYTGIFRLLFETGEAGQSPSALNKDTIWAADGTGFIAARTDWTNDATQYFGWAAAFKVDHQEPSDVLSFNLARKGVWLSKAAIGYGNTADSGPAANTLLIENAEDGRSSPTLRPVDNGTLTHVHQSTDYIFHAWEAADAYNMSGYYGTNYADLVTRQLALIGQDMLIVYDHTITDPTQVADLVQYKAHGGGNYTRFVKHIQHFQTQPTLVNGYYVASDAGQEMQLKMLSDASLTHTIVDESMLWSGASQADMPSNQRKWHIETEAVTPAIENAFVSVLAVGDTGAVVVPDTEVLFDAGVNAQGVLLHLQNAWHCLVFAKNPLVPLTGLSFDISGLINTDAVNYYINGLAADTYNVTNTGGNVAITSGEGSVVTATESVLRFATSEVDNMLGLAVGTYPITITATRGDGVTVTRTASVTIIDAPADLYVDLGSSIETSISAYLASDLVRAISPSTDTSTAASLITSLGSVDISLTSALEVGNSEAFTANIGQLILLDAAVDVSAARVVTFTLSPGTLYATLVPAIDTSTSQNLETDKNIPIHAANDSSSADVIGAGTAAYLDFISSTDASIVQTIAATVATVIVTIELPDVVISSLNHLYLPLESRHLQYNSWTKY